MDNEKKKIEKLEHPWADNNSGCGGASYDDIIDKINEIVDVLNGKEEPELRESEDERIRNCLRCLTSLDQAQDVIADMGFTRQDLLSYLEKQKEQNLIPSN